MGNRIFWKASMGETSLRYDSARWVPRAEARRPNTSGARVGEFTQENLPQLLDFQHPCAANSVVLEGVQGSIGLGQREYLDLGLNRNFGGHSQEIVPVLPRVVGNATDHALLIEQVVVERRDGAHVDAAECQDAALLQSLQRSGHYLT